jgi:hypothetical protein
MMVRVKWMAHRGMIEKVGARVKIWPDVPASDLDFLGTTMESKKANLDLTGNEQESIAEHIEDGSEITIRYEKNYAYAESIYAESIYSESVKQRTVTVKRVRRRQILTTDGETEFIIYPDWEEVFSQGVDDDWLRPPKAGDLLDITIE